jgi:hypothetical protein
VIATVYAVRVDGHGTRHLSLHTTPEQATAALYAVACEVWAARFDYVPGMLAGNPNVDAEQIVELLDSEGWTASADETPVEL